MNSVSPTGIDDNDTIAEEKEEDEEEMDHDPSFPTASTQ